MTTRELQATVRSNGGPAIIDLQGDINSQGEAALNRAYDEATALSSTAVLLNFSGVTYINSTGIALIVALLMQARKSGVKLMTCGLKEHYLRIFQITRLADFMSVYADEESAVQATVKTAGVGREPGTAS